MDGDFRVAEAQHGVITRRQLRAAGRSDDYVDRLIRADRIERIHRGVFRIVGSTPTTHQLLAAATLWLGDDASTSHRSALWLLRLDRERHEFVYVTVPPTNRRGRSATAAIVVHRSDVPPSDRRVVDGIRCTSAARTLLDCATLLDAEELETAVESARRLGLATAGAIRRVVECSSTRAGVAPMRRVLMALESRPVESRLEVKLSRLLRDSRLPESVAQFRIGSYRVDRAWPASRVAVEADGFQHHGRHLVWKRDRRRIAEMEAAGWRMVHVTWDDVTSAPTRTLDRIAIALGILAA